MRDPSSAPPAWALRLLRLVLPRDDATETVLGDLVEEFNALAGEGRRREARRRFLRQALAVGAWGFRDRVLEALRAFTNLMVGQGDGMMRNALADVRIALRSLARAPGFTSIAVLMLAIGIGANTAIFSAVNGVLLEPLAFPNSDELVSVRHTAPGFGFDEIGVAPDTYVMIKEDNNVFTEVGGWRSGTTVNLTGEHDPKVLEASHVSWELPRLLGMPFSLGRGFSEDEDLPGGPDVVVISRAMWQQDYGSDPSILGRALQVDGAPHEVVGVLPGRVDHPALDVDLWLPLRVDPNEPDVGTFSMNAIARLDRDRTPEVAEADLGSVVERMLETYADADNYVAFIRNGRLGTLVDPLKDQIVGDVRAPLLILLGTVGFVLLIACANVANLVLVRSEARQKEIAVRAALGAGRGAVLRTFLAESLVLALAGGLLGILLAYLGLPALLSFMPETLPRADGVGISATVLMFTGLLIGLSVFVFGVIPGLRAFSPKMFRALKHARGSTNGRSTNRLRNLLVAGQTALALMLLIGSGLMLRSFAELRNLDPGFEAEGLLTMTLSLPEATYESPELAAVFHTQALERLASLPGVLSVGAAEYLPLSGGGSGTAHRAEDVPVPPGELAPVLFYKTVTEGYFETMQTSVLAGRTLERSDHEQGLPNVVINRAAADRMWPGQDALGRRLGMTSGDSVPTWYTVVGVVETVRDEALTEDPRELVYYPMVAPSGGSVAGAHTMAYVIRTAGDPSGLASTVRATVWDLDTNLPIADMREMGAIVAESTARMSFTMIALGVAALVALLLGAIGLYGVLSYIVAQRSREIGVRMALGAERSAVRSMVVRQGVLVAGAGLLVGVGGALALTRVLDSLLYGTSATDPLTYATTSLLLMAVGVFASYLPARRASGIDPMQALRAE